MVRSRSGVRNVDADGETQARTIERRHAANAGYFIRDGSLMIRPPTMNLP